VYGFIKKIYLFCVLWLLYTSPLFAAVVQLNATGGSSATNALRIYIDDTTQIQVRRLDNTGQLYSPSVVPTHNNLDNGIYLRANGAMYGPDHFAYSATTDYSSRSVSTVVPATPSQGVTQSTTSSFRVGTLGPQVTVVWKYIYPLDYVTAEVTLVIPVTYAVSANNPVRYYHAVDTYLGGSDNGCGVRYIDANGKQVVGTYPLSSGNCPSSNSLPANLDVVESFRERNGKFDHYCVGFWNTFWSSSSSNACAIGKSTSLSDTVTTTYQDTGAAIEYDFTAPGIYTFSYDFVVGSTFVPNYDHLEIRHPGTGTLCPVEVKVLACTSSVVPCPDDSMINTGSLTGNMTYTPGTPSMTASPSPFEIGSSGPLATVTLQGSAAATYVLGASGLSKAPLNGVKCLNTTTNTQSCSFTFSSTPCLSTFECMESGLAYNNLTLNPTSRNPIYTKLSGKGFDLDVHALTTAGVKATGYTGNNVTVELVNDANGCGSTVLSKTVAFQSSDAGKKTVSFTDAEVAIASPGLRCRVTDNTLNKVGCSTDNFALRPQTLTVSSTNAQLTLPAATPADNAIPVFKAATTDFNLTVSGTGTTSAAVAGYNGTPKFRAKDATFTPLSPHPSAPLVSGEKVVGVVTGNFSANSGNFRYSEVGHFKFNPYAVYDDTFTNVDFSNSKTDCDNTTNPFDNSGVGTPKKYGCRVQIAVESNYFGRFIPDRFLVERSPTASNGCGTFSYFEQDPSIITPFKVTAQNGSGATTQSYTGSYAKLGLTDYTKYTFVATSTPTLNGSILGPATSNPITKIIDNTLPVWGNGVTEVKVKHKLTRPVAPVNKQNVIITAKPVDTDSVTSSLATALNDAAEFRYGRLAILPAHGSELLPLAVPIEAQYYKDGLYIRSTGDSCTTIDPKAITMKNYKGNLSACETYITNVTAVSNGGFNVILAAPKIGVDGKPNIGSVDLEINLNSATGEQTCQSSGAPVSALKADPGWFGTLEPTGRASFGIYKAPIIYMRENF
jgi:MSHA biogenesis protein MshQ